MVWVHSVTAGHAFVAAAIIDGGDAKMTKSDLIQAVTSRMPHWSARDVEIVVNTLFEEMTNALKVGDRVELRGFGSFSVRHRRAYKGRNPKTSESIAVPSKRAPFFTVGRDLKKRVDAGRHKYPITGGKADSEARTDEAASDIAAGASGRE